MKNTFSIQTRTTQINDCIFFIENPALNNKINLRILDIGVKKNSFRFGTSLKRINISKVRNFDPYKQVSTLKYLITQTNLQIYAKGRLMNKLL